MSNRAYTVAGANLATIKKMCSLEIFAGYYKDAKRNYNNKTFDIYIDESIFKYREKKGIKADAGYIEAYPKLVAMKIERFKKEWLCNVIIVKTT